MNILIIVAIIILLVYCLKRGHQNTKDVSINKLKINSVPLNSHKSTLKILQLSDMHLENISISPHEMFEKLKAESIDLIALTGDYLDRKWTIPKIVPYLEALNKLNPQYGIYAVFGNHDYVLRKKNLNKLTDILQQYNCRILINENESIFVKGIRVNIIGIDDFKTKRSDVETSYKGIKPGINLVLTHDPNIVLHMKDYHFDYLLAGHFHGGQICYPKAYHLIKMGKLARMNIVKGLQFQDGKPYYISEGLGQTGLNIRVGSRPELTIHELTLTLDEKEAVKAV